MQSPSVSDLLANGFFKSPIHVHDFLSLPGDPPIFVLADRFFVS